MLCYPVKVPSLSSSLFYIFLINVLWTVDENNVEIQDDIVEPSEIIEHETKVVIQLQDHVIGNGVLLRLNFFVTE